MPQMSAQNRSLFVDTSGWIEVFGKKCPFHHKARTILYDALKSRRPIITSNYVITEFIGRGGKACNLHRSALFKAVNDITQLGGIEIIHIGKESHDFAITYLRGYLDKDWSLVDATSFNIMKQRQILEALATDLDFVQAGFVRLLP
jgi:uncharacterized protein